jgi:hypothetical protein
MAFLNVNRCAYDNGLWVCYAVECFAYGRGLSSQSKCFRALSRGMTSIVSTGLIQYSFRPLQSLSCSMVSRMHMSYATVDWTYKHGHLVA